MNGAKGIQGKMSGRYQVAKKTGSTIQKMEPTHTAYKQVL